MQKAKNRVYQKSTFKFINDEEYETRQNRSTNQKREGSQRRIIMSPKRESSMSDDGLREPQEDLKQFAQMQPEKEHSSCPQMHLTSLHSVQNLPTLKRVESEGKIAEESEEDVQMIRGKQILGSGRDLPLFNNN